MRFTVFLNNTHFQIPRAIIFKIETNTNASFVFEGGEESDVLIFDGSDPNLDPVTAPILKISKPIVYENTQGMQAGEYEGELTVIVVAREEAGIIPVELTSEIQIAITTGPLSQYGTGMGNVQLPFNIDSHSLTGGGTTDVTSREDHRPTVNLSLVWIMAGAVALAVLVAVCSTICFCGVQRQRKHIIDTGVSISCIHTWRSATLNCTIFLAEYCPLITHISACTTLSLLRIPIQLVER